MMIIKSNISQKLSYFNLCYQTYSFRERFFIPVYVGLLDQIYILLKIPSFFVIVANPNKLILNLAIKFKPQKYNELLKFDDKRIIDLLWPKTCDRMIKVNPRIINRKNMINGMSYKNEHIKLSFKLGIFNDE